MIHASGFVLLRRVVFQHINMMTGALVKAARVLSADTATNMSWYGGIQPGIYSCWFEDVTSNSTSLIQIKGT
jgi:hypothetical protein